MSLQYADRQWCMCANIIRVAVAIGKVQPTDVLKIVGSKWHALPYVSDNVQHCLLQFEHVSQHHNRLLVLLGFSVNTVVRGQSAGLLCEVATTEYLLDYQ